MAKLVVLPQIVAQQTHKKQRFFSNRTSLLLNVIDSVQQVIGTVLMVKLMVSPQIVAQQSHQKGEILFESQIYSFQCH